MLPLPIALALLALLGAPEPPPAPSPPPAPASGPVSRRVGEWPERPSGRKLSPAFMGEHLTVDEALERIADSAGWNLVANTGRLGDRTLVLTLRDVPVETALDAVLEGSPLVATRRGDTVTVAPGLPLPAASRPVLSGIDRPSGKRFSGDLVEVPVGDALRKIADAAAISIVLPPGLRGTVSGRFKEAPVEEVLRAVLSQAGLVASREGSILTVARGSGPAMVIEGNRRARTFGPTDEELQQLSDGAVAEANRSLRELERAEGAADKAEDGAKAARGNRRKGHDRVLRGSQVIGPGERAGDVVVIGGSVRLEAGATADQVTAILGSIDLAPGVVVDREVVAIGGDVHVSPGAHVGADAVSIGGRIVIDQGGEVEGGQTSIDVPGLGGMLSLAGVAGLSPTRSASRLLGVGHALAQFAAFFTMGLLFLLVAPRRLEALTGSLTQAPVKAVLTGILGMLALPVIALLLVVTIVGIPLVAVLLLGTLVAGVMGFTALAMHFGRALPLRPQRGAAVVHLALGTAVLVAVGQIPLLGFLSWAAVWLFVLGVVLRTRFGRPATASPVYGTVAPPPGPVTS